MQTQITFKRKIKGKMGTSQVKVEAVVGHGAAPPKKKRKNAVTECCVWARYKSQGSKTGSVYTAHPHKLASPCHPRPTTGFTHAL